MGKGGTASGPEGRPQLGKRERMHLVPDREQTGSFSFSTGVHRGTGFRA